MNFPSRHARSLLRAVLVATFTVAVIGACDRHTLASTASAPTTAPNASTTAAATPTPATPAATAPVPTLPAPAPPAPSEGLLVLAAGEEAKLAPATVLRFERIVSDSRCPADVQCVWAGEVTIALLLTSPSGPSEFELSARENKTRVQSFDIELMSFAACPVDKAQAALGRECASLKVEAAGP